MASVLVRPLILIRPATIHVAKTKIVVANRTLTQIEHPKYGTVQGPYYRYEHENLRSGRTDNSELIIETCKLTRGDGATQGFGSHIYSYANVTLEKVRDQMTSIGSSFVEYFISKKVEVQPSTPQGPICRDGQSIHFDIDRKNQDPDLKEKIEHITIIPVALTGNGRRIVIDPVLAKEAQADAEANSKIIAAGQPEWGIPPARKP